MDAGPSHSRLIVNGKRSFTIVCLLAGFSCSSSNLVDMATG
jgi:hypothetical protein